MNFEQIVDLLKKQGYELVFEGHGDGCGGSDPLDKGFMWSAGDVQMVYAIRPPADMSPQVEESM